MTDEQIKSRFAEAGDFVTRTLRCDGNTLYAYYIDGLTSGGDISEYVFRPISENLSGNLEEAYDAALHGAVYNSAVSVCEDVDEVALKLVNGFCIVLFPGVGALAFEVKTGVKRGPSSPEVENTVKGPKDAFVETIRVNTSLIRRHLRTPELRLEAFVHGAMCVSFSGRCLLSNYLTGRDANRGQCAQPCRWKYHLVEEKRPGEYFEISEDGGTHIMNSRDMCMIEHIPELIDAGIDSFKIEGRMKSSYYAAVVTNAYRHAIDAAVAGAPLDPLWVEEVNKVSHRPYTTGFYFGDPGQYYHDATYFTDADVAAVVETCDADGNAVLCQRNKFYRGDELELLTTDAAPVKFTVEHMYNSEGEEIDDTRHAMMAIHMRLPRYAERYSIVRKCR